MNTCYSTTGLRAVTASSMQQHRLPVQFLYIAASLSLKTSVMSSQLCLYGIVKSERIKVKDMFHFSHFTFDTALAYFKVKNQLGIQITRMHFNFSQAEMCNGLKSVGTICYRAYGSYSSAFQSHRPDHIFPRGISIPCEKIEMRLCG